MEFQLHKLRQKGVSSFPFLLFPVTISPFPSSSKLVECRKSLRFNWELSLWGNSTSASFLFRSGIYVSSILVDSLDHLEVPKLFDRMMMDTEATSQPKRQKEMCYEEKQAAVHEEIKRMNQLPANSTYVTHRLRVLSKILQLMSIQRTQSQQEELELLFAGLSL